MKKIVAVCMVVMVSVCLLAGCGAAKLSDAFDQDVVEQTAKDAVAAISNGEFDKVNRMLREDLQAKLTTDIIADAFAKTCSDAGAFDKIESMVVAGQKIQDEDSAVVIAIAKYENKKVQYTFTFDTDMRMTGLYMK